MNDKLWEYVDATGDWFSRSYGIPRMTGRVFAWLLVCDPPEQTAAEIGSALDASKGAISGATVMLVKGKMVDRIRVRGERADRFRIRPDAWDEQLLDSGSAEARLLIAHGLDALAGEPAARRRRLEDLEEFYAWWEQRAPELVEEWHEYRRSKIGEK